MIYILTGDIRTGKTTALLNWVNTSTTLSGTGRNDVDGLLCPDNENGKRYFLNVRSQEQFELEVETKSEETITIGSFYFLKHSFQKACWYLIHASKFKDHTYLVLDELGKLELKNKGLHESAITIINSYQSNENHHLILVVRESLLTNVIEHYSISEYSILKKEDLNVLI